MKAIIEGKAYKVRCENNTTARDFQKLLPFSTTMSEMNCNEKYAYTATRLTPNSYKPEKIEVGDIMLFSNNCIELFYDSVKTDNTYSKIGHIENMPSLDRRNIKVTFVMD